MRLRSLAPAQRWAAGLPLVEESGDALLTNQVMPQIFAPRKEVMREPIELPPAIMPPQRRLKA